jgi:peptidyl-prolyl cis-trans isomerase SurA
VPQVPACISCRRLAAAAGAAAIIFLIANADAQVVTTIDGQPITEQDIQQCTRYHELATHKTPDRQDIIDELSNEIEEIWQAQRHAIAPSDAEVNKAFENIANRMGVESQKLTDILTDGGASAATLKQRLRAQIAKTRLERGGFDPHGGGH